MLKTPVLWQKSHHQEKRWIFFPDGNTMWTKCVLWNCFCVTNDWWHINYTIMIPLHFDWFWDIKVFGFFSSKWHFNCLFVQPKQKQVPSRTHKLERLHSKERERRKHSMYRPKQSRKLNIIYHISDTAKILCLILSFQLCGFLTKVSFKALETSIRV